MSLTVSELLALEGLSALRLRAGKQGLQRAVRWYYVAENEHIAEWIMGGELVFITGINHPRDEANLIQLLMEGKQRGIAGMVILTGEAYIHAIPATLIALADELGMPLIEQPYLLKMVIVTERIGTALVRSENVLQSQRDILMQLVTGDYPDLQMLHQRLRVVDIRLNAVGHQHAIDVVPAIGRHRHGRHGGAVFAAGDADDGGFAAAAGHLLAHPLQHPGQLELYVESAHVIPPVNG